MVTLSDFHYKTRKIGDCIIAKNCSLSVSCLTKEAVTRSTLIRLPPQELVGTFPRGEGKIFMFFIIQKLICISMFLALGE